ncbi:amidohydrolase family protein [Limibacillus sp. MBR-115]|jgi:imidazolonepropionase-like amidohydrolase|uniref:metal-dependent hydrolase family protein n=1 Tax=Limibacillus sp. MBR-115 TaxID=3156465 RepID=UPI003394C509
MTEVTIFRDARIFDFELEAYREDVSILVEGNRIREVVDERLSMDSARLVDCKGRIVMPGLIDAHVHVIGITLDIKRLAKIHPYLVAAKAKGVLEGMLLRGFTSVRDAGGADVALADAVAHGYFAGPRLFVSGLALARPGAQGDFREAGDKHLGCPVCQGHRSLTQLVKDEDQARAAVRRELAKGAHQIKVMASGGIASRLPLKTCHFSLEELRAITDEAHSGERYVMAHAYENVAVQRCLEAGVRSIEHGSRLNDETLGLMKKNNAFLVPTLSAYDALRREGRELGMTGLQISLFEETLKDSLDTLDRARSLGVYLGHGSDLEGRLHSQQSHEFVLKSEVLSAREVVKAATLTNAQLLGMNNDLGVIAPGALADLLLVEGDPYEDATILARPEQTLALIMQGGRIVKDVQ